MIEEQKTCQVMGLLGKLCGRPVIDGDKCICHSKEPEKDVDLFQKEIDEQLTRDDLHDFSDFVFPKDFRFLQSEFPKDAHFNRAQFSGEANFLLFQFSGHAHFGNTKFSEEASFRHAKFSGMARFWSVQFSGEADFAEAQFTEGCGFDSTQFSRKADFRFLKLAEATQFVFRKTDLHNCLFLRTDIARIEFTDVMWPRRRKLFGKNLLFRRAVADELDPQQTQWEEAGRLEPLSRRDREARFRHLRAPRQNLRIALCAMSGPLRGPDLLNLTARLAGSKTDPPYKRILNRNWSDKKSGAPQN